MLDKQRCQGVAYGLFVYAARVPLFMREIAVFQFLTSLISLSLAYGQGIDSPQVPIVVQAIRQPLPLNAVVDFGAVADGVTDDTEALQAAIEAAQGASSHGSGQSLSLPCGTYLTRSLTISGPLTLSGSSSNCSVISLKFGVVKPLITVKTAGPDPTKKGAPQPLIALEHLRMESQAGAGTAGDTSAFGLALLTGAYTAVVNIDDVTIWNMPSDGIHAEGFVGFLRANRSYFSRNGRDGWLAASSFDWRCNDCEFEGNSLDNISLYNDGNFYFLNTNSYGAGRFGLYTEGLAQHYFVNGSFDRNGREGAYIKLLNGYDTSPLVFNATNFGLNGLSSVNTFADVTFDGGAGVVSMPSANFTSPYGYERGTSRLNIQFTNSSNVVIDARSTLFRAGNVFATKVSDDPTKIVSPTYQMHNTSIGPRSVRLTGDAQGANRSNCLNLAIGNSVSFSLVLNGIDLGNPNNSIYFRSLDYLFTRTSAKAAYLKSSGSTSFLGTGVSTGFGINVEPDEELGCLNVSVTPPLSNSSWSWTARIRTQ